MKILTTLFFTAVCSIAFAQIPNASFENWQYSSPPYYPISWTTANRIANGYVVESSNAHDGTLAARLNSMYNLGGYVETWDGKTRYFTNSGNPDALNGWYILNSVGFDELEVIVNTKCSSGANGIDTMITMTPTSVYKQFSACINYTSGCAADSAAIFIELTNANFGATNNGSYLIIDDLSFGPCATSGIDGINNGVTLESAYPNPASQFANIIYAIPNTATVSVALYDLNGRKVMDIVDNTNQTPGRYKIPVDVTKLANGVYFYTVSVDGVPYTQKLVVAK
jgi:hypothetical protein